MMGALAQQTELLRLIAERLANPPPVNLSTVSTGQLDTTPAPSTIPTVIVATSDKGKQQRYTRETHPALFAVVDWYIGDVTRMKLAVRKVEDMSEAEIGQVVSKSWVLVARQFLQSEEGRVYLPPEE